MLQPLVPGDLAPHIERHLATAMRSIADESIEIAGGACGFSGPGSWSNQAAGLGFAGEVSAADMAVLIDFYASRGVEPKVEAAPHADASLHARLREAGFGVGGFEQVLVRHIGPGTPALPAPDPAVRIEAVDSADPAARRRFLDVQTRGFMSDDAANPSEHDLRLFPRYMMQPNVRAVMAFVNGEPAGVGLVGLDPPIAQLFGASTRPGLRGRGVQRALILARLLIGAESGCTLGNTDSAAGGGTERNAVRLGFSPLYTRISFIRPGDGLRRSP